MTAPPARSCTSAPGQWLPGSVTSALRGHRVSPLDPAAPGGRRGGALRRPRAARRHGGTRRRAGGCLRGRPARARRSCRSGGHGVERGRLPVCRRLRWTGQHGARGRRDRMAGAGLPRGGRARGRRARRGAVAGRAARGRRAGRAGLPLRPGRGRHLARARPRGRPGRHSHRSGSPARRFRCQTSSGCSTTPVWACGSAPWPGRRASRCSTVSPGTSGKARSSWPETPRTRTRPPRPRA